ncbi:MAG TPA: parallel beta-helix domain-containing protein [Caulobacterales bacterium]|nr:parallel beta-helix domain-containing protein [Caulobacterales bacterium]
MKAYAIAAVALLIASPAFAKTYKVKPGPQAQAEFAGAFAALKPGDRIALEKGRYELAAGLSATVNKFSLRGEGPDKTVLSFTGQTAPAPCLSLSGAGMELRGFAVENCKGDAIRTSHASMASLRDLVAASSLSGVAVEDTQNVLLDNIVARGAANAGLRLSQAQNVVVQNSTFAQNTIGAAIENSVGIDFTKNMVTKNAVGVAAYDLPGKAPGQGLRIVKNQISGNDGASRGPAGTFAASAPVGTGVVLTATLNAAVLDNDIGENGSVNVFLLAWRGPASDAKFSALPRNIIISGNRFGQAGMAPGGDLKALAARGVKLPDILWDGSDTYFAGNAPRQEPVLLAISNNKGLTPAGASFLNLGLVTAGGDYEDAQPSATPPPLSNVAEPPPVKLPGGL